MAGQGQDIPGNDQMSIESPPGEVFENRGLAGLQRTKIEFESRRRCVRWFDHQIWRPRGVDRERRFTTATTVDDARETFREQGKKCPDFPVFAR